MATGTMNSVVRHLRRAVLGSEPTDGQLLECFLARRDEAAFEALVRRHGPMVLGVCQRVLRHTQDAEDAFQATFLVLVRKAASVRPRERVGNWLYGVAYRTALKAKVTAARRQAKERRAMPRTAVQPDESAADAQALLDRELHGLPDKYRVPVVLADLEGKSRQEVARQLGLPEGTVSSRLARARQILRRRLARNGVTQSAGMMVLAPKVPPMLIQSTVRAALGNAASAPVVALAEGVLKAMLFSKLKIATALVAAVAVVGTGLCALADRPAPDRREGGLAGGAGSARPGFVAKAQKEKKEHGPSLHGTLKAIGDGKITVAVFTGNKKETADKTFGLASDVKVFLAEGKKGEEGKLADLSPGLGVEVRLSVDQKSVEQIVAHGPTVGGTVKAVDPAKNTITIGYKKGPEGLVEKTFELPPGTPIHLPSRSKEKGARPPEGKLADLTPGTNVVLQLSVDKKHVRSIAVQVPSVHGTIKELSPGKGTVRIESKGPDGMVAQTFTLAKDVTIHFADGAKGDEGKLADLAEDMSVTATLSLDRKTVLSLFVPTPSMHGNVRTVDPGKRTIVISTKEGGSVEERSFDLAKGAKVILVDPGKEEEGKLEELAEGTAVMLTLSRDKTQVLGIHVEGPTVHGVVKSVDGPGNTVTVGVKEEGQLAEKTFTLAKGAPIGIREGEKERPGNLSDLSEGMGITVRLSAFDKKTAVAVYAAKR
jgi:RNA polymerase sigma factor (sigma-70 family)